MEWCVVDAYVDIEYYHDSCVNLRIETTSMNCDTHSQFSLENFVESYLFRLVVNCLLFAQMMFPRSLVF